MTHRLPAEWEPQQAIWFVWPRDETTWPGEHLAAARVAYAEAIRAIAPQPAHVIVHPGVADSVPELGPHATMHELVHVDSWIRDYGPLTVADPETPDGVRSLDFRFDAWGGKYESLARDDDVTGRLFDAERVAGEPVLEGGAVETDGKGTFLATRSVAAARGQTDEQHAALLRDHLGAGRVIWLDVPPLPGDDTDGHIDTIARFTPDGSVLAVAAAAPDLLAWGLKVRVLPDAPALKTDDGEPLPTSYANFLIANEVVLVPTFGGLRDVHAIEAIGAAFPGRRTVGIDHRDLIWGFGGIHCLTMQIPRAP